MAGAYPGAGGGVLSLLQSGQYGADQIGSRWWIDLDGPGLAPQQRTA